MYDDEINTMIKEAEDKTKNINKLERIFQKIILKLRYHKKQNNMVPQFCKYCGSEMGYDYSVNDNDWNKVCGKYKYNILCISCFCKLYPEDLSKVKFHFCGGYNDSKE